MRNRKDEFYTQLVDIENELKHYREHFRGKTVLCLLLILVDIFYPFPDMVVTCFLGQVDKFLTSLTVFLKRLTTAYVFDCKDSD